MSIQFASEAPAAATPKKSKSEKPVNVMTTTTDIGEVATVEQQIEQHAQNIERIQRDAVFDIGRELDAAQELHRYKEGDDGFVKWMARRLPHIPQRSAYQAIEIYRGLGEELFANFANMKPSALAETAKAEPDVKAIIAERVEAGEVFTAAQVKDIKDKAAKEADEFKAKLDAAEKATLEAAEKAKANAEKRIKELEAEAVKPVEEPAQPAFDLDAAISAATRSKDDEIAALKAQIENIQNDPAMKAMREAVESAARSGGKKSDNKNVHYEKPTAEYEEMMKVVGTCRILLDRTKRTTPAAILAGFHDAEHRADGLQAISDCRDFLNSIMEVANAA